MAQQVVVVEAAAPLVQTKDSTISHLVDEKTMRDLPLNGRSYTQLAVLQPNVIPNTSYAHALSAGTGMDLIVQGQRPTGNLFLLDGTEANDYTGRTPAGTSGNSMGVEGIREFSLLTGNYSAEYGHFMGGVLNVVTRSGTNTFHGNAFEFLRNSALDAKNFFDRLINPIPPFKRNQFGGTLGGPIKKDRAFFFGDYEGFRESKGLTLVSTVPNAAAHLGILPSGPVTVSPSTKPLLDAFPLPNGRDFGDGTGEFVANPTQTASEDYFMTRTDYQISNSQSLFGRYTFDQSSQTKPEAPPIFTDSFRIRDQFLTLSETSLLSPTALNVFGAGFTRTFGEGTTSDNVSFPPGYTFLSTVPKVGSWIVRTPLMQPGACSGCRREDPRFFALNVFDGNDKVSMQKGPHSITFGGTVKRYQLNELSTSTGQLGQPSFNSVSDFIQGRAAAFTGARPGFSDVQRGLRSTLFGLFLQDNFQLRPNLTLNLGLRWEMATSPNEVNGKMTIVINPITDTAVAHADAFFKTTKKNFAPRMGFAWDPSSKGKTSIRAGFGIFYNIITPNLIDTGVPVASQSPYAQSITLTSNIQLPRPFELSGLNLPSAVLDVSFFPPVTKAPTRYFWTFGIQQELVAHTVISATYSGSRSAHLITAGDMNQAIPTLDANGQPFFPPGLPRRNSAFGMLSIRDYGGNSFYHALGVNVSRRLAKGFQGQLSYTFSKNIDDGTTLYSAGTGSPEASNTSGVAQNFYNRAGDRSLSTFDIRHSFIINATWDLPFGKHNGAVARVLDGWQLNSILTRTTGFPFTPEVGFLRSLSVPTGAGTDRPNLAPGRSNNPVLGGPDHYFDPTAFVLQPAGYFGNLGRGTLIGPGLVNFDFSLRKNTAITERTNLEFRAEFFNILNHPNFGRMNNLLFLPSGARVGNTARLTDTRTDARQIQFGLKLSF